MSELDGPPPDPRAEEIKAAEPVVWDSLRRILAADGNPQAQLYLQELVKVGSPQVLDAEIQGRRFKRVRFSVFQLISDYNARFNANSGHPLSWFVGSLMENGGDAMPESEGLEVARRVARPPADAVLEQVGYEEVNGEPVFVARWVHRVNDILVEPDYIHVLINGRTRQPFALRTHWHTPAPQPSVR